MNEQSNRPAGSGTAESIIYRTVKIDGLDIFYREAGPKEAPDLLLLHGFPTSSQMFRNLIPTLADKYHVVAPDYPGYGNSSMPPRAKFDVHLRQPGQGDREFTEKIGLKRYSMYVQDYGAPVGYRLAVLHPERFRPSWCRTATPTMRGLGATSGSRSRHPGTRPQAEREETPARFSPPRPPSRNSRRRQGGDAISPDNWEMDQPCSNGRKTPRSS